MRGQSATGLLGRRPQTQSWRTGPGADAGEVYVGLSTVCRSARLHVAFYLIPPVHSASRHAGNVRQQEGNSDECEECSGVSLVLAVVAAAVHGSVLAPESEIGNAMAATC